MPLKDALLSDICISTSAAPTYFPAHYFQTKDSAGTTREFNLVDGGVAANNPVTKSLGINTMLQCYVPIEPVTYFEYIYM